MNLTRPAFVVDGMLGGLARKLRMFGFDTLYYNNAEDARLIDLALEEERVLLTGDKTLHRKAAKAGARGVLLTGANELDDAVKVLASMGIASIEFAPERSRCPLCNATLEERDKDSMRGKVHAGVLERHSRFYLCTGCSKVYWEGSHIKKVGEFERSVNGRLSEAS